ncbi:MAG: energy transducer TonB [Cyclobacteriaceae bacterium]|nr:energy transducer TonB [Cyclobacteriaceae bacterium]
MKNKLSIILFGIALVTIQACGPKTDKNEAAEVTETPVMAVALTAAERRAGVEKARIEMAEQRRIAFAELSKETPYYTLANGKLIYNKAETSPSFVGGEAAMSKFLKDNLEFPASAENKGSEGTVFVDFIVGSNGAVREATATSYTYDDVDPAFPTEALRVVNAMPRWIPGRQHGKPVDVKFSVPITFMIR